MTPTVVGRIQTRIVILATLGSAWTLLITLALPGAAELGAKYRVTFRALVLVIGLGVAWELVYHSLQQLRWEKDWPTLFGLVTGVPEGIVVWVALLATLPADLDVTGSQFLIHFVTTWLVVWLFLNGPMRVIALRWRFRGGRLV